MQVIVTRLRSIAASVAPMVVLPVLQLVPWLQVLTAMVELTGALATPPAAGARREMVIERT